MSILQEQSTSLVFFANLCAMLSKGTKVPPFTGTTSENESFDVASILGKKPIVIFFYPKNNTPVCTKEACAFRDAFEDFTDHGVSVIGISSDSVASHKAFASQHRLPFTLLSDEKGEIQQLFGVERQFFGLFSSRITFVIDKNGQIAKAFKSQLQPEKHVQEALEALGIVPE